MTRYQTSVGGPTPAASLIAPVLGVGQDISIQCVSHNLISSIRCPMIGVHLNNFNNRTEEAIGSATDIWTAYREGRMGKREGFRPLLGYFFLLEDCPEVHRPVSNKETHFPTDPAFKGASYCKRYELLCKRLVQERLYDVSCLTLATNARSSSVKHTAPDLSFELFAAAIKSQVAKWLALKKATRGS